MPPITRVSDFDDIRGFNSLLQVAGGAAFFKAIFGQYNFTSILEFSHLSITSQASDDKDSLHGFVALNDSTTCLAGDDNFDGLVAAIKSFIPSITVL